MIVRRSLKESVEPLEVSEPVSEPSIEDTLRDNPGAMSIDTRVPPKIMRLTQHMHNLIYIRFFYEQLGQQPPVWIKRQLERAEADLLEEIDSEESQGGHFHRRHK